MEDNNEVNSSDIEFEAPSTTKLDARRGRASIEKLIKHAESGRLSSKKTVTQL